MLSSSGPSATNTNTIGVPTASRSSDLGSLLPSSITSFSALVSQTIIRALPTTSTTDEPVNTDEVKEPDNGLASGAGSVKSGLIPAGLAAVFSLAMLVL